jgi:hypothetical protein
MTETDEYCACGDILLTPQENAARKCMVCMFIEQQDREELTCGSYREVPSMTRQIPIQTIFLAFLVIVAIPGSTCGTDSREDLGMLPIALCCIAQSI